MATTTQSKRHNLETVEKIQSTIYFENGRLRQRIGQWTAPCYWPTQYHYPTETAYIHNGTTWK
eukprot:14499386-Ditylum_brightwellii.AAC.1